MPSPKYPLKPLLEHRERQVDTATAELASKVRAREEADDARVRAEADRRATEEELVRVRSDERRRLEDGVVRAVDLARSADWQVGADAEMARLTQAASAASERAAAARTEESEARARLGQRKAEHDVVRKDAGRFEDRLRKRALSAEEEAAEEAFRGGRR